MLYDNPSLERLRAELNHGSDVSQARLDSIAAALAPAKAALRPTDKSESLPLFSIEGRPLGTTAPRWLCHLLALRHCCAHVMLEWRSPTLGDVVVLQMRAFEKDDSPGRIDISVGGHMTENRLDSTAAAMAEMLEETGLTLADLEEVPRLIASYAYDEAREADKFWNHEWRDVYIARMKEDAIKRIHFSDGEVAAVVLVGLSDASRMLRQTVVPLASALKESLPRCLAWLSRQSRGQ